MTTFPGFALFAIISSCNAYKCIEKLNILCRYTYKQADGQLCNDTYMYIKLMLEADHALKHKKENLVYDLLLPYLSSGKYIEIFNMHIAIY